MKHVFFIAVLLILQERYAWSQQTSSLQINIAGVIVDSLSKKPVAYATVNLLDTTNNIVASGYAGESGTFALRFNRQGNYMAEITAVGYRAMRAPVVIKSAAASVNVGQVAIASSAGALEDVTVTSGRKLVEQKPGMLIYNAENDVSNKGGTAADVLRKAPVLNVDAQGNVSMRGSDKLKILINGKYSGQMARSPADALNMMSADIVKSVEIITTPSAKYDAEGAAGVINIITKKGRKEFNGTIEAVGSNYNQMINPRLSFGAGKWNFNFTGHLHQLRKKERFFLNRIQKADDTTAFILNQQTEKDNTAPHCSADMSLVYAADSMNELSLGFVGWMGKWPDDNTIFTAVKLPDGTISEEYLQSTRSSDKFLGGDFNISYDRKFKKPGRELNLLIQFSPSRARTGYHLGQQSKTETLLYQETNKGFTNNREWTVQLDYNQPLAGRHSFETGLKIITRNVTNRYDVSASSDTVPGILVAQPLRSDVFMYGQDVYTAYALLKLNLSHNWYVEAGARVEETNINGSFKYNGDPFENNFTNFIPTATITRKINGAQSLGLSYTKRLTRPYIWDLNPNADASDPKNIVTGNPGLRPELAHQAEITYSINGGAAFFINTALFWKQTNNAMIDFTTTSASGISVTSKQNLAANKQYGLNVSYSVSVSEHLSINGNINTSYLDYSSKALQVFSEGWAADAAMNIICKLPQNYMLQLFGEYDTRKVTLQGYKTNSYYYNLAVKKAITSRKITIIASLINPFSAYIPQTSFIKADTFESAMESRYYSREFKLALNWELGNAFRQKEKKKVTNDDINDKGKG
ncbi:outer membrane beta-barrel protein [Parafilimonas sp.]|uniref:outer membrane beta-barrel protein n=1 Tax=Parafilimonas sp. TaxID=1969739 RepID=UPI0039E70EB7